ncbi:hypothetical protein TetV_536 [Tetraselmis virus 1]|uniref:Uncharacterized protein n=1 Tax=Tetraselmis virus 1 TaxID=2060617 RepID=A0A2P0VNY2_9VIRU|nr:hypothetical protein QJ968_gp518 [Tetraselmis virus 1]AUF82618.1 hypothetical protein TetV_536 [Tetraselmis virus 1]
MDRDDTIRAFGVLLILAQSGWIISSFHSSAIPLNGLTSELKTYKYIALGMNVVTMILALRSISNSSSQLDNYVAGAALISTGTTAAYASKLRQSSVIAKMGYGAALFTLSSALAIISLSYIRTRVSLPVCVLVDDPESPDSCCFKDYELVYYDN